ncbi:MAG: pentapeptide repeat-containing protein [Gammaproteobacteria bacterium]|nr:pentapeptide repeat-containing protein [Gammaproteobacteria bacterium]
MAKNQEFQDSRSRYWKIMKTIIIVIPFLMLSTAIYFSGTTLAFISIANNNTDHFLGGIADDSFLESIQESYQLLLYGLLCLFGFGILICFAYFGFYKGNWHVSWKSFITWILGIFKTIKNHKHPIHISVLCLISIFLLVSVFVILFHAQPSGLSQAIWFIGLRLSSLHEPLNIRNIMIGAFGGISLLMFAWRSASADRDVQVKEQQRKSERDARQKEEKRYAERRFDERFANAVKSLSTGLDATSYPAHLGAITALRNLAIDNNDYMQQCLDILCSCNQWMEGYLDKFTNHIYSGSYVDKHLTESNRIAPNNSNSKKPIELERRSQQALIAIADVITKTSENDNTKQSLGELNVSHKMLCGINLSYLTIAGINLKNAFMNGAYFKRTNVQEANLSGAMLQEANFEMAKLQGVNLSSAQLQGANLSFTDLCRADINFSQLQGADISYSNLQGANLLYSKLQGTNLSRANLQGANLQEAQLQGASLEYAQLQGANLFRTELQGATLVNANMDGSILLRCNLYGTEIRGASLSNIMFGDIGNKDNLDDKNKIENFRTSILSHFYRAYGKDTFIKTMQNASDRIDSGDPYQDFNILKQSSIVNKDEEDNWTINLLKKDELKGFYRKLFSELSEALQIPIDEVITLINQREHVYQGLGDTYPQIAVALTEILSELSIELKNKEA